MNNKSTYEVFKNIVENKEQINVDLISQIFKSYKSGELDRESYNALIDNIMNNILEYSLDTICPKLDSGSKTIHFKVEKYTINKLQQEINECSALLNKIDEIRKIDNENASLWIKEYKLVLLKLHLAVQELMHRDLA